MTPPLPRRSAPSIEQRAILDLLVRSLPAGRRIATIERYASIGDSSYERALVGEALKALVHDGLVIEERGRYYATPRARTWAGGLHA